MSSCIFPLFCCLHQNSINCSFENSDVGKQKHTNTKLNPILLCFQMKCCVFSQEFSACGFWCIFRLYCFKIILKPLQAIFRLCACVAFSAYCNFFFVSIQIEFHFLGGLLLSEYCIISRLKIIEFFFWTIFFIGLELETIRWKLIGFNIQFVVKNLIGSNEKLLIN